MMIKPALDNFHEEAMKKLCEEMDAKLVRDGLELIDGMSRAGLLVALGWDSAKDNTERLRKRARLTFLSGSPHFDLLAGYGQ